jgi:hypothetical protein
MIVVTAVDANPEVSKVVSALEVGVVYKDERIALTDEVTQSLLVGHPKEQRWMVFPHTSQSL